MSLLPGTLVKMLGDGTFITLTSDGRYLGRTTLSSGYSRDYQVAYLPSGEMITVDGINLEFYNSNLAHVNGIAAGQVYYWVSSNLNNRFYYSVIQGISVQRIVTVNGDGSFVAFHDLATPTGGDGLGLLNDNFIFAVSPDGLTLYCTGSTKTADITNPTIDFGRWTVFKYTLSTGVQGTDFATYGYPTTVQDIKVMANGDVLVLVGNRNYTGSSQLLQVDRYNPSGVLQHTYQWTDGYAAGYSAGSLAIGFDNTTFWIHSAAFTGIAFQPPQVTDLTIQQVRVSDGVILSTFPIPFATNSSPANHSQNPFFIVPSFPLSLGSLTVTKITNALRGGPGNAASFAFQTNGGLSPEFFNLLSGQSITFPNVIPGVYGIFEIGQAGWLTTYDVSNGSFIDSLVIGNGEIVTITVLNTIKSDFGTGIYKLVSQRRTDRIYETIEGSPPSNVVESESKIPDPFAITSTIGDE